MFLGFDWFVGVWAAMEERKKSQAKFCTWVIIFSRKGFLVAVWMKWPLAMYAIKINLAQQNMGKWRSSSCTLGLSLLTFIHLFALHEEILNKTSPKFKLDAAGVLGFNSLMFPAAAAGNPLALPNSNQKQPRPSLVLQTQTKTLRHIYSPRNSQNIVIQTHSLQVKQTFFSGLKLSNAPMRGFFLSVAAVASGKELSAARRAFSLSGFCDAKTITAMFDKILEVFHKIFSSRDFMMTHSKGGSFKGCSHPPAPVAMSFRRLQPLPGIVPEFRKWLHLAGCVRSSHSLSIQMLQVPPINHTRLGNQF